MSNAIMESIMSAELENGSIKQTPLFDKRLVYTRKWFNNGTDPIDDQFHDFDFNSAQIMLDEGEDKQEIGDQLGVSINQLNRLIKMGALYDEKWKEIRLGYKKYRGDRFQLYKDGKYQLQGTIPEIAEITHIAIGTLRYWNSKRYRSMKSHKVHYRLILIKKEK